jgi:GNAT superfamily N-acetyltransferase
VYNEAFRPTWEYTPLTDDEVRSAVERLLPVIEPDLIRLVLQGDDIVGFLIAYPDISAALQRTGGRLWPFGWAALLRERSRTRWANINGMGLLPAHQGTGANAVLYAALARSVGRVRFEGADVVQVDERNAAMVANLTAIGVPWHQRHRVYRRPI